jgi:hypothetical protein
MSQPIIDAIVKLWSQINPVASYTSGYTSTLNELFFQTPQALAAMAQQINQLSQQLNGITDPALRATAQALLINQQTQMDLARASGAGPSGTGAGGVYAAADGVFYITLKGDYSQPWVNNYLSLATEMISFETQRWQNGTFTLEEKKECLNTVIYMQGALQALVGANPALSSAAATVNNSLNNYQAIFYSPELASNDFSVYWPALQKGDAAQGPTRAKGYPGTLQNYYTLGLSAEQVEQTAQDWLLLDLPVTRTLSQRIGASLGLPSNASLQQVWDSLSAKYAQNFTPELMQDVLTACNNYGQEKIIGFTAQDVVKFSPTPSFLQNLVTGGEDFAINYLSPTPYSQLYLTASKNTSLLTMINILVHEASHGFNFVMSARLASSPLLNLNTSLQVPMTEGQAFYREYQYYAGAADLLTKSVLTPAENAYLQLYGNTAEEQAAAIEGAALETYIWRVIRYIRALCDVQVNGGKRTYTDFIAWAAQTTGLSQETLHGECFTFMASPGYAPCYALGGAIYAQYCTGGYAQGVSELQFNTQASAMGFWGWPQDSAKMAQIAQIPGGAA